MSNPWDTGPRLPSEGGRYIPLAVRNKVVERDNGICQYCGNPGTDLDHIYPWSNGGTHHHMNLVVACETCNSIAGTRIFTEFMKKKMYVLTRRIELYQEQG